MVDYRRILFVEVVCKFGGVGHIFAFEFYTLVRVSFGFAIQIFNKFEEFGRVLFSVFNCSFPLFLFVFTDAGLNLKVEVGDEW